MKGGALAEQTTAPLRVLNGDWREEGMGGWRGLT